MKQYDDQFNIVLSFIFAASVAVGGAFALVIKGM